MSALTPSASPNHFPGHILSLGEACRFGHFVRHCNGQQKMNRHVERAGELLMQRDRPFAFSCFKVGKIALRDTNGDREFGLYPLAPLAQDTDGIFARRQSIDDGLGQHDFCTGCDRGTRIAYDPGRADILPGSQRGKPVEFAFWQNGEFLTARRLDELHFAHAGLSIINFTTMADGSDDDGIALDIENDAPVANAQPRPATTLEPFHVAVSGFGKNSKLGLDSPAHIGGKAKPLPRDRAGERDLHVACIAESYIFVKHNIAKCNITRLP